jgi:hypothetical protein
MITLKKAIIVSSLLIMVAVATNVFSSFENEDNSIRLRWIKSYPTEDWAHIRTGIIWSFSYLGATLPKGSLDNAITKHDESSFTLDLSKIGFSDHALNNLRPMLAFLRASEEYEKMGGIDLGRFQMYTLHSSWNYYAITGAEPTIEAYKNKFNLNRPVHFFLSSSGVAKEQRIISFNAPVRLDELAFVGKGGKGKVGHKKFTPETFETIDVMPNGQLRFAIYNKRGFLETAADTFLTVAGKPGKCQWCHEKHLQTLHFASTEISNSIKKEEFIESVSKAEKIIDDYRKEMKTDIIYQNHQDHTQAELLYITFLEPSLERIANEWGISTENAALKMANFPTHVYKEFPFLGQLYYRKWVDSLAPYKSQQVPESAREVSHYEPDVIGLNSNK